MVRAGLRPCGPRAGPALLDDAPEGAATLAAPLAAGSQAEALVAQRGSGVALALWPDARQFPLLAPDWLDPHPAPLYGRAPDAKLPGGAGVIQDRRP